MTIKISRAQRETLAYVVRQGSIIDGKHDPTLKALERGGYVLKGDSVGHTNMCHWTATDKGTKFING